MIQECRKKYYHPRLARKIKSWVTSCRQQKNWHEKNPSEYAEQHRIHFGTRKLPRNWQPVNLTSSNGYQHFITMMDNFSHYLFAYPTQDMTANKTVARCIIDVMTRHCYLPTVILTDKGSQLRSEVVNQIAETLEIRISHASPKDAQIIGILEKTHASLKTSLKLSTGELRSMWLKDVQIAVINWNTSYPDSLGCELTTVFHGRIPYNILDIRLGLKPEWTNHGRLTDTDSINLSVCQRQLDAVLPQVSTILRQGSECYSSQSHWLLLHP